MVSSSGSESGGGAAGQRSSRLAALARWPGRRSGSAAERLGGGTDGRLGGWAARRLAGWRAGTKKLAFLNLKKKKLRGPENCNWQIFGFKNNKKQCVS